MNEQVAKISSGIPLFAQQNIDKIIATQLINLEKTVSPKNLPIGDDEAEINPDMLFNSQPVVETGRLFYFKGLHITVEFDIDNDEIPEMFIAEPGKRVTVVNRHGIVKKVFDLIIKILRSVSEKFIRCSCRIKFIYLLFLPPIINQTIKSLPSGYLI